MFQTHTKRVLIMQNPSHENRAATNALTLPQPLSKNDWQALADRLDTNSTHTLRAVTLSEAQAVLALPLPTECGPEQAADHAAFLAKALPTGPDVDHEVWISDAILIFSGHAELDVRMACKDPVRGLRSRHRWLPQPPDMIAFMAELTGRRRRIRINAEKIAASLAQAEPCATQEERDRQIRAWENVKRRLTNRSSVEQMEVVEAGVSRETTGERVA